MGFKITRDFIKDKGTKGLTGIQSTAPNNPFQRYIGFTEEQERQTYFYHEGKIRVRLLDDDKNVYFHAFVDDIDMSCEFLYDFGIRNYGCTSLDLYKEDWDKITNNREHPYLSKDGKWYSYMG